MTALDTQDLYAALLHEMKNNLVLTTITMDRIPHVGNPDHDMPLDEARRLCQRVSERLMQALMIYKCDIGGMVLNAVDAYSTEDFVAEMAMRVRYMQNTLEVDTHIDPDVPAIWFFDRNMIELALMNAIHNSVTYARERIRIRARVVEGMLIIAVQDDSDGYPSHILEAVAANEPLASNGTGLGLRFANLIAKAHEKDGRRGRLALFNDGGAVFEMHLP